MLLTNAEWKLMNALWKGSPAAAREIEQRLHPDTRWAYTTIKTMLARLVAKGAVSEHKRGNLSFYEPVLTRRRARSTALKLLMENAFEGAFGPLMHFLLDEEKLSASERRHLGALLEAEPKNRRQTSE